MREKLPSSFWRRFTAVWTAIFFAAIIYDFFTFNALDKEELLLPIAVIYDAVLAIYSADKEFKRWHDCHDTIHPGELYVICWTVLVCVLLGVSLLFHYPYHVPSEVSASYIVVVSILAITKESKHLYKQMKCEIEGEDGDEDGRKDVEAKNKRKTDIHQGSRGYHEDDNEF